jgi:multiphosphoryl transfer protein
MVPMVSAMEEIHWVKEQLEQVKSELASQKLAFNASTEFGIMIEVPSVVPALDKIAEHVDFCSIGTNDLVQYFFAADRGNAKVNHLANCRHPAFLRMLREICTQMKKHGKWVGLCGEMAGDSRNLPLFVALGLDEISMAPNEVPFTKQRLAHLSSAGCDELLDEAIACETACEVEALIDSFLSNSTHTPLIDAELVVIGSESTTREEAIRELVDLLDLTDRTQDPDALEDAVWERESTYSTDMSLGFALPHCKSNAVGDSSVAMLRLNQPVLWEDASSVPVSAVILLAMKDDPGKHMQVMSKLARKLMNEDFRQRLITASNADEVVRLLSDESGIAATG